MPKEPDEETLEKRRLEVFTHIYNYKYKGKMPMKKFRFLIFTLILTSIFIGCAQLTDGDSPSLPTPEETVASVGGLKLVDTSEFNLIKDYNTGFIAKRNFYIDNKSFSARDISHACSIDGEIGSEYSTNYDAAILKIMNTYNIQCILISSIYIPSGYVLVGIKCDNELNCKQVFYDIVMISGIYSRKIIR